MVKMNFYLSEQQIAGIKRLSNEDGLSVSEHIRRAVSKYIEDNQDKEDRTVEVTR